MKDCKFAERLKELRTDQNLDQTQLARILKVSKGTICKWEKGVQTTDLDMIITIAEYFKVSTDYLLGLED